MNFEDYSRQRKRTEIDDRKMINDTNHTHFDFMKSMEGIGMENCTYGKLMNWSMGLAGESGEVVDILKKILFHGHPIEKEKLLKELGDILWYLDAIASSLGSSLNEIAELNVEKLKKRYPDGFSEEKSINRKE
ncbi:MAG: nucleoside triphosphate pyrophosphohydrolase family protein [Candidatus Thermoplasmatota archaeon]|nr:nucleoside triphosphate pyrophosphohydrolase family protein [Candidatus Thermoplasmatota archaeon]MCL5987826.1 nucleoside triphosphate pyrophosphohydrolase family protein [Candidatus Thermoplasmatota archaeon]